jgi:uncharacterized membrane protein YccC
VHRVLGTLVGVGAFALLSIASPRGLLLALVVGLLQLVTELVIVRHYGLALVIITPLALTVAEAGSGGPLLPLVADRVVDTAVGSGVALIVLVADLVLERLIERRRAPERQGDATCQSRDRP